MIGYRLSIASFVLASTSAPYCLAKARSLHATLCPTLLSIPAREGNEGGEAGAGRGGKGHRKGGGGREGREVRDRKMMRSIGSGIS